MRSGVVLLVAAACSGGNSHQKSDASSDGIPPGCGDGVRSAAEICDGTDLGGATCATATAPGWVGVVACTASCQLNIAGCSTPNTTWNSMTIAANWSLFDVGTIYPGAKGFASSVFDGRYMYFVPNNNGATDGVVTRFDTQGGFGASPSWVTFDVSTINASAKGFIGGAFDGRYVYFVPYNNGAFHGTVTRYDSQADFTATTSWQTFNIATLDPNAVGFVNAAFDGRYVYFSPYQNSAGDSGLAARYDTSGEFTTATSWSVFDMSTVNANAKGYLGVAFDGRYVYYAPYHNATAYHGTVMRFDTQAAGGFTSKPSWSAFNAATTSAHAVGFYGIAFDGHYVYFVQHYDGGAAMPGFGGYVTRYDTQADFQTGSSWSSFNAGGLNASAKGFVGAAFDGRYIYAVPHNDGVNYVGETVRYDTQGTGFTTAASWSVFDTSKLGATAVGFHGAGFDGQYVYLVPNVDAASTPGGVVARFSTKTPSWLPLNWNASFD